MHPVHWPVAVLIKHRRFFSLHLLQQNNISKAASRTQLARARRLAVEDSFRDDPGPQEAGSLGMVREGCQDKKHDVRPSTYRRTLQPPRHSNQGIGTIPKGEEDSVTTWERERQVTAGGWWNKVKDATAG
jgi:hypothetical protein